MTTCKRCNGTRWIPFDLGGSVPCPDCKGTGEVSDDESRCPRCGERAGFFHVCKPKGPADSKTNEEGGDG